MTSFYIHGIPGFEEWRAAARHCLANQIAPHQVHWQTDETVQTDMFGDMPAPRAAHKKTFTVPKEFLSLAEAAICHKDLGKFSLLYKILWRLNFENKHLLHLKTDNDVMRLTALVKAVRHDAYKITAFLRFRQIRYSEQDYFVAWYETEHYSLERVLPFFQTRFRNMRWSILTPYRAAHWDGQSIMLEDNPDPALYPKEDQAEQYWLGYYANIFNPARPKKSAMLNQMPKKYWKMMPETVLIPDMLRTSHAKAIEMVARGQNKPTE